MFKLEWDKARLQSGCYVSLSHKASKHFSKCVRRARPGNHKRQDIYGYFMVHAALHDQADSALESSAGEDGTR